MAEMSVLETDISDTPRKEVIVTLYHGSPKCNPDGEFLYDRVHSADGLEISSLADYALSAIAERNWKVVKQLAAFDEAIKRANT